MSDEERASCESSFVCSLSLRVWSSRRNGSLVHRFDLLIDSLALKPGGQTAPTSRMFPRQNPCVHKRPTLSRSPPSGKACEFSAPQRRRHSEQSQTFYRSSTRLPGITVWITMDDKPLATYKKITANEADVSANIVGVEGKEFKVSSLAPPRTARTLQAHRFGKRCTTSMRERSQSRRMRSCSFSMAKS